jgi:hypothetical protein
MKLDASTTPQHSYYVEQRMQVIKIDLSFRLHYEIFQTQGLCYIK